MRAHSGDEQAKVFCIDIAAYAVMSNHFHIVLHVNQSKARELTDLNVVRRWYQLYKVSVITQKFERGDELSEGQLAILVDIINDWRDRLMSISWYMRRLNETVARLANDEDNCTGHLSLRLDAEHWLYIPQNFESEFKGIVGAVDEVKSKISLFWDQQRERRRTAGIQACS